MKLKLMIICISSMLLFGCSTNKKEKTTICSLNNEVMTVEYEYISSGDQLLKMTIKQVADLSNTGLTTEQIDKVIEETKKLFDVPGITYDVENRDSKVYETIVIDTTIATMSDLIKAGVIDQSKSQGEVKSISLKETIANVKNAGGSCK